MNHQYEQKEGLYKKLNICYDIKILKPVLDTSPDFAWLLFVSTVFFLLSDCLFLSAFPKLFPFVSFLALLLLFNLFRK